MTNPRNLIKTFCQCSYFYIKLYSSSKLYVSRIIHVSLFFVQLSFDSYVWQVPRKTIYIVRQPAKATQQAVSQSSSATATHCRPPMAVPPRRGSQHLMDLEFCSLLWASSTSLQPHWTLSPATPSSPGLTHPSYNIHLQASHSTGFQV